MPIPEALDVGAKVRLILQLRTNMLLQFLLKDALAMPCNDPAFYCTIDARYGLKNTVRN